MSWLLHFVWFRSMSELHVGSSVVFSDMASNDKCLFLLSNTNPFFDNNWIFQQFNKIFMSTLKVLVSPPHAIFTLDSPQQTMPHPVFGGYKNWNFPWWTCRFNNYLELLRELRNPLGWHLLVYYKGHRVPGWKVLGTQCFCAVFGHARVPEPLCL